MWAGESRPARGAAAPRPRPLPIPPPTEVTTGVLNPAVQSPCSWGGRFWREETRLRNSRGQSHSHHSAPRARPKPLPGVRVGEVSASLCSGAEGGEGPRPPPLPPAVGMRRRAGQGEEGRGGPFGTAGAPGAGNRAPGTPGRRAGWEWWRFSGVSERGCPGEPGGGGLGTGPPLPRRPLQGPSRASRWALALCGAEAHVPFWPKY